MLFSKTKTALLNPLIHFRKLTTKALSGSFRISWQFDGCGNYSRFRKSIKPYGPSRNRAVSRSILSGEVCSSMWGRSFNFRNRLKHYIFVTGPQRLVDPVSSGVYVHAESYRSGSSKAIMGVCLIEYTPQSKWGQRAMGEQPGVPSRTWKRVRNLCIPLPEHRHCSRGESHGVSHEKRHFTVFLITQVEMSNPNHDY